MAFLIFVLHLSGPDLKSPSEDARLDLADLEGIADDFKWTGHDAARIDVWARVSVYRDGKLVSVDRGAHSSVTAYFNETNEAKSAYNEGEPRDDWATYLAPWSAVLAHTGHYSPEDAEKTLRDILPDVLRFDRSQPAAYPNGRTLSDDVEDIRLQMVSNHEITGDGIGPHTDLLTEFPYLGHPHKK
ncbi:DUF4331 family protein [Paracoccus sp. 11-3]|uniref:DUF4331 family protein n=1 Tax=Paracoccus amoyensis TaxID=2760093 RepID=A0A926JC66_9RHOB|nr:DUF4331 family protein [Paracoccus amoyensis]